MSTMPVSKRVKGFTAKERAAVMERVEEQKADTAEGESVNVLPRTTLRPKKGIRMRVIRRG